MASSMGLAGPGVSCTKSISSEYRNYGYRYNLCSAVPPLNARLSFNMLLENNSTTALVSTKSCSTWEDSFHGATDLHASIYALGIIVRQFLHSCSELSTTGLVLFDFHCQFLGLTEPDKIFHFLKLGIRHQPIWFPEALHPEYILIVEVW